MVEAVREQTGGDMDTAVHDLQERIKNLTRCNCKKLDFHNLCVSITFTFSQFAPGIHSFCYIKGKWTLFLKALDGRCS